MAAMIRITEGVYIFLKNHFPLLKIIFFPVRLFRVFNAELGKLNDFYRKINFEFVPYFIKKISCLGSKFNEFGNFNFIQIVIFSFTGAMVNIYKAFIKKLKKLEKIKFCGDLKHSKLTPNLNFLISIIFAT